MILSGITSSWQTAWIHGGRGGGEVWAVSFKPGGGVLSFSLAT